MESISQLTTANACIWDGFVLNHPEATPYHLSHWVNAVEQAYGHKAAGYIATDSLGKVTAVLPLSQFKTLKQRQTLCSLPFCDVGGVLAHSDTEHAKLLTHLSQNLNGIAQADVDLRERGEPLDEATLTALSDTNAKVSMMMPLSISADELLASFKPKLRSQIKKAEKNGLRTNVVRDASLLEDFYQVMAKNMRDLGSPVHSKAFFKAVMEHYGNYAVTAVVYKDDVPCAAGLVLCTNLNACIPWASSLRDYNKLAPNMLLYWTLLAHVADNGIAQFDFGRSTVNEGTYRFKKQWGATPVALNWRTLETTREESAPVTTGRARKIVEQIWQRMPLRATTTIGPAIRKYISL